MSWKQEIIRALLIALGSFQMITNTMYLTRKNGSMLARKQHSELPPSVTDKQIKVKVICMLAVGVILFTVSLLSYILRTYLNTLITIALSLLVVYGVTEAVYYRYWKTFGFAAVTIVLLIVGSLI